MGTPLEVSRERAWENYRKAGRKLGTSPRKAMKWLIAFAKIDPAEILIPTYDEPDEAFNELRIQLAYFLRQWNAEGLSLFELPALSESSIKSLEPYPVSLYVTKEVHALVRKHIYEFVENGATSLPEIAIQFTLKRSPQRSIAFVENQISSTDTLTLKIFRLLQDQGSLLRRCPGCATIFLANRRDQEFHNNHCRMKKYMANKRNTPPDRINKRGRPRKVTNR